MTTIEIVHHETNRFLFAERGEEEWNVKLRSKGPDFIVSTLSDEEMALMFTDFVTRGYSRFALILEDSILISPESGAVVALDIITGATAHAVWTVEQINAVCALAIGGDEIANSRELYEIANKTTANWPIVCRPML